MVRRHRRAVNITLAERAGRVVIGLAAVVVAVILLTAAASAIAVVLEVLLVAAGSTSSSPAPWGTAPCTPSSAMSQRH